jgi:hypothetical protein
MIRANWSELVTAKWAVPEKLTFSAYGSNSFLRRLHCVSKLSVTMNEEVINRLCDKPEYSGGSETMPLVLQSNVRLYLFVDVVCISVWLCILKHKVCLVARLCSHSLVQLFLKKHRNKLFDAQ